MRLEHVVEIRRPKWASNLSTSGTPAAPKVMRKSALRRVHIHLCNASDVQAFI